MIFLTANDARAGSRNNIIIHKEIRDIEDSILHCISLGIMSVQIKTTTMTNPGSIPVGGGQTVPGTGYPYMMSWRGLTISRELDDQMNRVIEYFTDLGYTITRKMNTDTNFAFYWELLW